jgi:hypothetical protein
MTRARTEPTGMTAKLPKHPASASRPMKQDDLTHYTVNNEELLNIRAFLHMRLDLQPMPSEFPNGCVICTCKRFKITEYFNGPVAKFAHLHVQC